MYPEELLTPGGNPGLRATKRKASAQSAATKCILRRTELNSNEIQRSASEYKPRSVVLLDRCRSEFVDRPRCITFRDDAVPLRGNPDGSLVLVGGRYFHDGSRVVFLGVGDAALTNGKEYYVRGKHPVHWVYERQDDPCGSVVDLRGAEFVFGCRLVEADSSIVDDLKHQRAQVRRKMEQAENVEASEELQNDYLALTSQVRRKLKDINARPQPAVHRGCELLSWEYVGLWLSRAATGPSPVLSVGVYG